MRIFWTNNADRTLIPFLDQQDQMKLSMCKCSTITDRTGNKNWNQVVNAKYFFSTIVKSIKEVTAEIERKRVEAEKKKTERKMVRNPNNKF
jgi:hypothetical protein